MSYYMMLSPSVRFLSFRAISAVLACCVLLMAPACLTAADGDQENKISFMIISADRLLDDVEYMVDDLADRKKIWNEKIAESIELFLEGVDRKKPVRIDMFFDQETGEYYRPFFPITSVAAFRNNVDSFGIAQKPIARDVYSLSNAFEGFMKISKDYALFAPEGLRNIIDPKPPEVLPTVSPLIDRDFDAGVIIRHDATGMEVRRGSLAEIRKNVISGIKKKSTESVEEFEYRKLLALNRLKQFEDLYAEVATLDAGWVTDQEKKNGVGTLLVSGIEGTTVDKTIRSIADQKTRFHVMSPSEKSMGFGTMLYPLDERVQERLTKTLSAYEQVAGIKIDRKEDLKPAQKTAAKQAVGKTIKILNDGIALGVLDGFFDARRIRHEDANSPHEMVAGLRASAGRDIEEVLDLLPQIRETFKVRKDIEVVKDFHLHEVVLETNVPPMLNSLFG
ncbi:MAG: hypothetical protein KDA78_06320, partial [Planctomycetaceae bacterium]|nr:hypothetical protein [Planctomycetaceae bacterium]